MYFYNYNVDRVKKPIFEKLKNYLLTVPKNQGISFVIFVGLIAFIFGSWKIINTINQSFKSEQNLLLAQQQIQSSVEDQMKNLAELKAKDTDGDGLSDYDENYIYGTSPYLEDNDSDGYSDKLEIETGNDPLCPAGQKCLVDSQTKATSKATSSQTTLTAQPLVNPYNISPAEIRQLLINSGLDQASLNEIDDTLLQQMFVQAYFETESQFGKKSNEVISQPTDELIISSPAQLRELLIANGIPAEQVKAISDQELMNLYEEIRAEGN